MKNFQSSIKAGCLAFRLVMYRHLIVLVVGFWILIGGVITNFYSSFTLESERRNMIFKLQPNLAFIRVIDDKGQSINISEYAKLENKIFIAEFMYTKCKTLCLSLGNMFQQTQVEILRNKLGNHLGLISISFDVANENKLSLKTYRKLMNANPDVWKLTKMADLAVLEEVKNKLGLMVLQNTQKDFVHNSAFLVISPTGDLVGIYSVDDIGSAIEQSLSKVLLN